ncbi:hypothetical protein L249_5783 [Ophiocordyceps polyrhachis-furcata BCC 54312]|uniref:FAM192A/Fyv6 N-terminal domain-containing protein n=1 Tax=Ophiocordyceps polyrhachis-furcata BCC 54312 TaxID=1330021 RepID=A0A367L110_9HYPO|nr:hypothetical protein L249_5783 [Ophiocordyceps polyrhachis-furcata BCC 54312]
MASGFVSGGTIGEKAAAAAAAADEADQQRPPLTAAGSHKAEWEVVQQELAAERKRREEARLKAASGEEKTLYDILQANKAAKQAAFEEKFRLKNQFRALDDDEAEFLDEIREREREEEERVRRETEERVRAFRRARQNSGGGDEDVDDEETKDDDGEGKKKAEAEGEGELDGAEWTVAPVGRKRKRGLKGGRSLVRPKTVVVDAEPVVEPLKGRLEKGKGGREEKRKKKVSTLRQRPLKLPLIQPSTCSSGTTMEAARRSSSGLMWKRLMRSAKRASTTIGEAQMSSLVVAYGGDLASDVVCQLAPVEEAT